MIKFYGISIIENEQIYLEKKYLKTSDVKCSVNLELCTESLL